MKMKKPLAVILALCLTAALAGCGGGSAVYVQSVKSLSALGGIAPGDRFTGMVVSENVTEIQKDSDKTIAERHVKEGDDVQPGDPLFSYDTDELQLSLDKQKLEKEQLETTIENYRSQLETLEKERKSAGTSAKLQYTIQIQTTQLDLKEAELNLKTKTDEVKKSEDLLANATVTSPVVGRIQSISENGMDNYGNSLPFITIQQIGSYRIKGVLGELQRGGIMEGTRMTIFSRTDPNQTWSGTVTLVDYENPVQGTDSDRYYGSGSDSMANSSRYPFYVELDNTDGLLLGQHIYMELETEEGQQSGLSISGAFLCFEEDGTAYVWAEENGKLAKRVVTLGDYDPMMDAYAIVDGLTEADYIAFPDGELCHEGARITREEPKAETEPVMAEGEVA